jgi:GDYXXLXY protein
MTNLAAAFGRVPKFVLFGAAGVIQIALIGLMVVDRVMILRTGTDVTLQTRPLDPRDFLRGDYVVLGYDISSVPAGALKDEPSAGPDTPVFVKLAPNRDGFHEAISVHAAPVDVAIPEVLIRGHVISGASCGKDLHAFCATLQVRYGIERYFVPEGEGRKLENARNQRKLTIVAAVAPTGRAAIKRLLIDGEPVYDEPWF